MSSLPSSARVVVVGGGIIGTSIAYHLAKMGCDDVLLLERDKITSGTTWHAAGLMVTFGSLSETNTELRKYTKALYKSLPAETGLETGLKSVGFIEIASTKDYVEEYRRVAQFNRLLGVDVEEISPGDVGALFPPARTDDIRCGFYVKDDGRVNPVDVTMALAKGAKLRGAKIVEGVTVTGITKRCGAVKSVVTSTSAEIECEYLVNACGMWGRQFGKLAGVSVPLQAAEHYYMLTDRVDGASSSWPVVEDPAHFTYYREEGNGLLVGLFEPVAAAWKPHGIPCDASFVSITPDWDRIAPFLDRAAHRVPLLTTTPIKQLFCGPESFTPDLAPIVGEAPELKNYFVAAGMNSVGILTGGGIGRTVARWILDGKPDVDVTGMNITRYQEFQTNPNYLKARVEESLGRVYACHYPNHSMSTARGAKHSPLHTRLEAAGAHFKDVSGWEAADWFAPGEQHPRVLAARLTWSRPDYWTLWKEEHEAARSAVVLMDMSFMSKFRVSGSDAGKTLEYISANKVDGESNRITYTQWLDADGRIQADLTVAKLDHNNFLVVATDTAHRQVEMHLRKHAPSHVHIVDVTSSLAQINIQGPLSRLLLQSVTDDDLSDRAFPFRRAKDIYIGLAKVLCVRLTYIGELGYELYIPAEQALHVHDVLVQAGKPYGLRYAGLRALSSCRMEKAYRDFGHDLDNTDNIVDAGLAHFCNMNKPGGFIGKAAVQAYRASNEAHSCRIVQLLCQNPDPLLYHAEPVLRNGVALGYIRAASYGHTLGGAVGLVQIRSHGSVIDDTFLRSGTWEVNVAGRRYPIALSTTALYDPQGLRIKM